MTRKDLVRALGLAFLTFMLSTHYAAALRVCPEGFYEVWSPQRGGNICSPDEQTLRECKSKSGYWNKNMGEWGECRPRPVKNIGKTNTQATCEAQGHRWDQQAGRCIRSVTWDSRSEAIKKALRAQCAAKGGQIDEQTGQCEGGSP